MTQNSEGTRKGGSSIVLALLLGAVIIGICGKLVSDRLFPASHNPNLVYWQERENLPRGYGYVPKMADIWYPNDSTFGYMGASGPDSVPPMRMTPELKKYIQANLRKDDPQYYFGERFFLMNLLEENQEIQRRVQNNITEATVRDIWLGRLLETADSFRTALTVSKKPHCKAMEDFYGRYVMDMYGARLHGAVILSPEAQTWEFRNRLIKYCD